MSTPSEMTVTIKDEEKTLKSKFLIYEKYSVDCDDDLIKRCINEALKNFSGEPTDVKVRINLTL